ncbi:MAG: hypothetical protein CMI13_12205 [Oleibacter sp.]|nr:hypothetical protein [Thalassolituus sp.]|tara:strand:+ start:1015 stop:1398 length:384 start_codon:yes stop_codon:yes gene_type:complete
MANPLLVSDLVSEKANEAACVIEPDQIQEQIIKAIRKYAGYGCIEALEADPARAIDENLTLTQSEWAVIQPLFSVYCEYVQAVQMEASRLYGVGEFGRGSSEVMSDIRTLETELPGKAFTGEVITIL